MSNLDYLKQRKLYLEQHLDFINKAWTGKDKMTKQQMLMKKLLKVRKKIEKASKGKVGLLSALQKYLKRK